MRVSLRALELQEQVAARIAQDQVETITADVHQIAVAGGGIVVAERILPGSRAEAVHIIARAADEGVVASAAIQGVIAGAAGEGVGSTVASEYVGQGVARAVDGTRPR